MRFHETGPLHGDMGAALGAPTIMAPGAAGHNGFSAQTVLASLLARRARQALCGVRWLDTALDPSPSPIQSGVQPPHSTKGRTFADASGYPRRSALGHQVGDHAD